MLEKVPPTPYQEHIQIPPTHSLDKERRESMNACVSVGGVLRPQFLTIFDTCYSFLSEIDETEVDRLANLSISMAKEPMKSSVWRPRAKHHIKLIIDGVCKTRCLFEDYDPSFKANKKDYDMAEKILTRMVKSWDTDLSIKRSFEDGF